ncbi:hypothetical protein [Trichoplusia ni ascovirus 6b]|nr:hypothetical protein [Trichoplusia ni ascovirus 6b]
MGYINYITVYCENKRITDNSSFLRENLCYGLHFPDNCKTDDKTISVRVRSCENRIHYIYTTGLLPDLSIRWVPQPCGKSRNHLNIFRYVNTELNNHINEEIITGDSCEDAETTTHKKIKASPYPYEDDNYYYMQEFTFTVHKNLRVTFYENEAIKLPKHMMFFINEPIDRYEIDVVENSCTRQKSLFPYLYAVNDDCTFKCYNIVRRRRC